MKIRILATFLALMSCALLAVIRAQDINLTGYTPTFDDEFNALSVTTASPKGSSTWYYWPPYGAAGGYSESTWDIASFSVSSGILSDTAFLDSGGNWHSGNLSSMNPTGAGFAQQYGYFEIRCQMPNSGTGAWPAFWLNTQNGIPAVNDPTVNEEVDIFEWYGVANTSGSEQAVIQQASHNWDTDGSQNESAPYLYAPQTPIPGGVFPWQGYHIYGCQVDPAHITWYIDGIQTNQIATPTNYLSSPFYVMVDYALGGGWPLTGMVNDSSLDVDWVRVYSLPTWPVITSATTATGTVGSAFSYQLSALNSPTSYNATGLPGGLSVNTTTGVISGTPTVAGTSTVTLSATNASGTGTATLTLTVNGIPPPSTVSVNFAGPNTQPLQATNVTGAPGYTATNWNVFTGANQTMSSLLKDSTGSTAAGMTLSSFASATATLIDAGSNLTPDQKLFAGIIQAYYAGSPAVTISSIPYSSYDVVVYLASDTAGRTGTVSLSGSATTYNYSTEGGASQPTSYVQVTSTTSGNYMTGNYVIFTNLSGPSQTISLTPSNWSGLCGLQIVPTSSELAPMITSNSTAAGTAGGAFNYQITASNSPTSFNATGLPSGLNLNTASGVISGTPAATGTSTVTLSATNAGGTGTATLTLTVYPPAPVITSAATATGTAGTAFSYTLTAGNSPTSFNATGLPNGLSVNTTTGVISGTPAAAGTATVTLSATNTGGTGTATLTLTVYPPAPVITSAATATGTAGSAFNYQITAGNSPASFNATGLPNGLSVNTTTGVISGTPAAAGTATVTLSATNASGTGTATLTLMVNPPAPVITSAATAAGTTGTAFSYTITASNSPASYNATGLPAGLSVNTSTGVISGTPAAIGASTINLTATNAGGTGSATLTLTVTGPLTPATVSVNFVGLNPTQPLQATDVAGAPGYTAANWNVFTGANQTTSSLLKDSTGSTTAGVTLSSFASATATLIDSGSGLTPDQKLFAGIIQAYYAGSPAVTISSIPYSSYNVVVYLASDAVGRTGTVSLSGSSTTYYYSTEGGGSQPASYVQVTSTTSGNYMTGNYVVFANQSGTSQTISLTPSNWSGICGLQIVPTAGASAPVITSNSTAAGTTGSAFNYQITASNSPTSFNATGLPSGLSVNATTGAISGTPTAAGTSTVTLSATNVGGTGTATLTLTVNPPAPVITSSTAATGTADGAFNYQITANNSPTSYGATGLPAGLSINTSTGVISGTPTVAGTFTVTLSATNSGGTRTATLTLTLTVNGALTPATVSVNFAGPNPTQPLQATDVAGAPGYAVANWNVFTGANQTTSSLLQDAAGSTAAGVTLSSFASATATAIDSGSGLTSDQKLFAGIIQAYYAGSPAVTISSIPYSSYNVVVYLASDTVGRTGTVSLSGSSTTYYYSTEGGGSQPASYVQVTSTTSGNYMTGNYVVFANQSGASQTISLTPSNWSGICGLQIVPTAGVSAPVITSSATATGTTGSAFNYQITANNNPTSFNATGLPSGLSVNTTTGAISGTSTIAGIFSVNLSATNAFGTGAGVLVIDVTSSSAAPVINSPLTATGTAGSTLAYRLTATNGPTQYAAANLPAGLTLDPTTGIISGTVAAAGTYVIGLSASNSSGSGMATLTLTINGATAFAPAPSLTSATSVTATVGQAFTYAITASNSPTLYAATSLPSWLSLNAATGALSGTPTAAETDLIPITVANAGGTTSGILSVQVTPGTPAITSALTVDGYVSQYLDYFLTANNAPTNFSASSLPPGLSMNTNTGEISGTPTTADTYTVPVTATNSPTNVASGSLTIFIDTAAHNTNGPPVWTIPPVIYSTLSEAYSYSLSTNMDASVTGYGVTGLPDGLTNNPTTETISGTPTIVGTYPLSLTATNVVGTAAALTLLVVETNSTSCPPLIPPGQTVNVTSGIDPNYTVQGAASGETFSASGLPTGLSIASNTGIISGTTSELGNYPVTITCTNSYGPETVTLNLNVGVAPSITSSTNFSGSEGSPLDYTTTTSTSATSYEATNLPTGMAIDPATGIISGDPIQSGTYTATITASNAFGSMSTNVTFTIASSVPVVTAQSFYANQGLTLTNATISASNQPTSFSSTGLPSWATLNSSTGVLSGTPPSGASPSYSFTVTASNAAGTSASATNTINVAGAPAIQIAQGGVTGLVSSAFSYTPTISWAPPFGVNAPTAPSTFTWSATGLPSGLTIDSSSGVISGTLPGTAGTVNATLTASATGFASSSATLPITIYASDAVIEGSGPFYALDLVGTPFTYYFQSSSDGTASVSGLPPGLTCLSNASYEGVTYEGLYEITGTPTTGGTYNIELSTTDSSGAIINTTTLVLVTTLITSAQTAATQVGDSFSYTITTASGTTVTGFNAANLPPGLSINPSTGVISGTPVAADVVPITLYATTSQGTCYAPLVLTITAASTDTSTNFQNGVAPTSSYTAPSNMIVDDLDDTSTLTTTYNSETTLNVGNTSSSAMSRALISFDLSALPPNVTITSANLIMNASSANSSGVPLTINVCQPSASFNPASATWANNNSYNATLLASATLNPASVSGTTTFYGMGAFTSAVQAALTGNHPLDLMLVAPQAEANVQPGGSAAADYIGFATQASDPSQNPELVITYTLGNPSAVPVIVSSTTAPGIVGQPFTYTLTATGRPTNFALATGISLPAGLSLTTATGVISGTPTAIGSTPCSFTATNSVGQGPPQVVTINIDNSTAATSLSVTSGNNQIGSPGTFVTSPLIVTASTSSGPLADALVTFTAKPGQGLLGLNSSGTPAPISVLTVPTNSSGQASVYLHLPQNYGPVTITATAGTATPVDFVETAVFTLPSGGTDSGEGSGLPILSVVSGEGQSGPAGTVLQPFVVQAVNRLGQPMSSLGLTLSVAPSGAGISGTATGSFVGSLSLTTNTNGQALVYLNPSGSTGTINTISCAVATPVLGETPEVYMRALIQSVGSSPDPGGSATFPTDTDPTPIQPPTALGASGTWPTFAAPDGSLLNDATKVPLSWTASGSSGVTYTVQRSDGYDSSLAPQWHTINTTSGTTYTDTGLLAGIHYFYQVTATDGTRTSTVAGPIAYEVPMLRYMAYTYTYFSNYPTAPVFDGTITGYGQTESNGYIDLGFPSGHSGTEVQGYDTFQLVFNPTASNLTYQTYEVASSAQNELLPYVIYGGDAGPVVSVSNHQSPSAIYKVADYALPTTAVFSPSAGIVFYPGDKLNPFDASGGLSEYAQMDGVIQRGENGGIDVSQLEWEMASPGSTSDQVSWTQTNSNAFKVVDKNGNTVTSPITLLDYRSANSSTPYTVVPNSDPAQVNNNDTITFNLTSTANNGASLGTDQAMFTYKSQTDFSMSLDEAAGPKYRKVALNGLPLPDEKPQATGETDQEQEETYVDALTLGLRHSTTDVYLPVSGSDFSVSARRDFRSQVWSFRNGLRPHEQPDLPFGICWSSNLAPDIQFVQSNDPKKTQPDQAIVTDETGAVHTFIIWYQNGGMKFFPMPTAKNEQQTPNLETLTANTGTSPATYTFIRKYGATLTYQSNLSQAVAEDRVLGSQYSVTHSYARLIQATDRVGNTVNYTFANATNLVPETISVMNQPDTKLSIEQDTHGHVTAVWDAKGNETQFGYTQLSGGDAAAYQLSTVTTPDGAVTHYTYQIDQEPDQMPHASTDPGNIYWHADLASITDPNGNEYQFSYAMDQTKHNFMDTPNVYMGYYPQCGQPRNVTKVTMPDGTSSTWANNSNIRIESDPTSGQPILFGTRQNQVTDATGFTRTYSFINSKVFPLPQLKALYNTDSVSDSKIICYQTTQIDYGTRGTPGYQGTEQFTFDPNAAMALSQTTDLSGNVTTFAHADAWTASPDYLAVLTNFASASFNGFYGDPTSQTDALGQVKTFTYDTATRIMTDVLYENQNHTHYDIDSLGRRTTEKIYNPGGSLAQETDFTYGNAAYPGFMTKKCVKALGSPDPGWVRPLVTEYMPDQDGRVAQEITDPQGLGLTTTYTYDANGNKLTATDPDGHTTWFSYDTRNRLTTVTHADGSHRHLVYDARGNKLKEWDEDGHATLYAYDALNRVVTQARDMNGNGQIDAPATDLVTSYTYNAVNSKLTTTDPDVHTTTMAYDSLQRVTTITDALGQATSFVYGANAGGNAFDSASFKPTQTTDPRGYVTQVTYDALYRPTIKAAQIDPAGAQSVTSAQYDPVGNVILAVDPLGHQTSTTYDALNRPTKVIFADGSTVQSAYTSTGLKWQVTDELGRVTQTQYDAAARAVAVIQPLVNNGAGGTATPITSTAYDAAGNVIATINPLGQEWDNAYDARNRKVQALAPAVADASNGNAVSRPTTITAYDAVGNVIAKTDARGNTTKLSYDPANRLLQTVAPAVSDGIAGTPTTSQTYDQAGNVLSVTDPNGHTVTNAYDALNRLTATTDALGITVTNTYDPVGNKLTVTDGKLQTTAFVYDGLNRNVRVTDPAGHATVLAYDALNKVQRTDALGQVTSYFYDVRNRLTGIAYNSGAAANSPRNYAYDSVGNLLSVTEPAKTAANVAYTYDALNRVVTETSSGLTHTYVYDLAGNLLSTVYGGTNRTITSTYDALNRLSTMTESGRVSSYGYDLNGNITQKTLPNGDVETTSFDALNRANLESAQTSGAVSLYSYQYGYDLDSNVASIIETGLSNRTVTNTYDAINRLTQEAVAQAINVTTSYAYDNANNRTSQVIVGGTGAGTTAYSYNNLNQLTGWTLSGATTSYTYDNNGNRITRVQGGATDTYSYDFENRLIGLVKGTSGGTGTYAYTYDYRTRRIVRDESSAGGVVTDLVFSGGTSVQEYAGTISSANLTVEYIRGSDYGGGVGGILYTLRGGTPSYTHADKRGDIVAKTDGTGSLTYQAQYQAFGQQTAANGSTLDRQKSNSKDTDPTNLVDEGFRYRDLETGMFFTRDPAGFVDGPNLYTYVLQNPWTSFDPEGLAEYKSTIANYIAPDATLVDVASTTIQYAENPANPTGMRVAAAATAGVYAFGIALDTFSPGGKAAKVEKVVQKEVEKVVEGKLKKEGEKSLENSAEQQVKKNGCFAAGTLVATSDGLKKIEDIKVGDVVVSFDTKTGKKENRPVTEILKHHTLWWVDVKAGGETITATRQHRFWVVEKKNWVEAKYLRTGEHLRRANGSAVKVESVRLWQTQQIVDTFNLEVETDHVFFVGENSVLVHNGDDTAPEHEPQPHPLSPEAPVYPQTKEMPGSKLTGTDQDHPVPKSMGGTETRPMPSASNQVDKAPLDKELKQRYDKLVDDLKAAGKTDAEAQQMAQQSMAEEIKAHANSAPAMTMDPAKMDELCPK